jgi:hypothetical protein
MKSGRSFSTFRRNVPPPSSGLCFLLVCLAYSDSDDGSSMGLRNIGERLSEYTAPHPRLWCSLIVLHVFEFMSDVLCNVFKLYNLFLSVSFWSRTFCWLVACKCLTCCCVYMHIFNVLQSTFTNSSCRWDSNYIFQICLFVMQPKYTVEEKVTYLLFHYWHAYT